jgi:hypothetical protein
MIPARAGGTIWWLNPFWVLAPALVLLSAVAVIIPEADYQLNWRMPKIFGTEDMLLCWAVAVAFSAGCVIAVFVDRALVRQQRAGVPKPAVRPFWRGLRALFYLSFAATVFAYGLWFILIVKQAGLGIFVGAATGAQGSMDELIRLRKDAAITGVTSLTQAGIATGMLGVFLGLQNGWRTVRRVLVVLLAMTTLRAVFLAERLALIEVLVPGAVLWLRLRGLRSFRPAVQLALQVAPLAGALALYALFTFGESFRSWGYYSEMGQTSLPWFGLVRLSGYYVTSMNNGAMLWQEVGALHFPYSTLGGLWRFPLFGNSLRSLCGGSADVADTVKLIIAEDGNAEFNNPTGIFVVFTDYGMVGALIFFVLFGVVLTLLYRAFQRGSVFGLWLYPFVFMGLTDQLRTFYLSGGRTFVAWMCLAAAIMLSRQARPTTALRGRGAPSQVEDA